MSASDVELLRDTYSRWARGDLWTPEIFDPDVEIVWDPALLDVGNSRGLEAFTSQVRRFLAAWEEVRFSADDFVDYGDRVLVLITVTGRGKGSDVETSMRTAHLWTMREGRAVHLEGFRDLAVARARAEGGDPPG